VNIVLDASVSLAWYFKEERTPAIDAVLDQIEGGGAFVPAIWRLEIGNSLQMAVRRKRVDRVFRDEAIQHLLTLPITVDPETDDHAWTTSLFLSDQFSLTLYDAAYVGLGSVDNFLNR
jgi:predicted nucleic acid-binding protein